MDSKLSTYSEMVERILLTGKFNKITLSEELDLSRPTLNSRIEGRSGWKKLEKNWISHLFRTYCH